MSEKHGEEYDSVDIVGYGEPAESSSLEPDVKRSPEGEEQPRMGECCFEEGGANQTAQARGEMMTLAGEQAYVTKPDQSTENLLFFFCDGGGIQQRHSQLQADQYAQATSCICVMPDVYQGDANPMKKMPTEGSEGDQTVIEKIKRATATGVASFLIDMWLARHSDEKTTPIVERIIQAAKERFTPVRTYAIGVCFGGNIALIVAGTDDVNAVAVAHPTPVTRRTIQAIQKPVYIASVRNDLYWPEVEVEFARDTLTANGVEHAIHDFGDVPHGFTMKLDEADGAIALARDEAFGEMTSFISKH